MQADSRDAPPPRPGHGSQHKQPAFVFISQVYVPDPAAVQRLLAQIIFLLQAMWHSFFTPRLAGLLVSTSPPACGIGGAVVSLLRGVPVKFWVMDLNPDQLVIMKVLPPKAWPVRLFDLFNKAILWRASDVIVLDRYMGERVAAKARVAHKLHVLPPWPMEDSRPHLPHAHNAFRRQHVPDEGNKFVVMYAGNHTPANPLDTLLAAAVRLQDHPRLLVMSVGGGAAKKDVDELVAQGVRNIVSLPYQPLQQLHQLLSAADVHAVAMGNDMVGVVHPCKVYGAMAAHRPLLLLGPAGCHIGALTTQQHIGWRVEHGDAQGAQRVLQEISATPAEELQAMGERGAQAIAHSLGKAVLMQQLCGVLQRGVPLPAVAAMR